MNKTEFEKAITIEENPFANEKPDATVLFQLDGTEEN